MVPAGSRGADSTTVEVEEEPPEQPMQAAKMAVVMSAPNRFRTLPLSTQLPEKFDVHPEGVPF
jgi:hypothetical protein